MVVWVKNMRDFQRYDNCISLGWYCGTAASMGRYGLRSYSGPFDWYFSNLESVLKVMENNFSDFMKKENLFIDKSDNMVFYDKKYGFCCNHDIESDFEAEYPVIFQKYWRRAQRFMQDIQLPTCFIRTVESEEEIQFIRNNKDYIYKIIKRDNKDNEIIFLLLSNMSQLPDEYLWFQLGIDKYTGNICEMRNLFDSSDRLSEYCRKNILADEKIELNRKFDIEHLSLHQKVFCIMYKVNTGSRVIESIFREYYLDKLEVILWGAGFYGRLMLEILQQSGIKVEGIIDSNLDKIGKSCEGIPIMSFSEITKDIQNIFIGISSEKISNEIKEQIVHKYPNIRIYSLIDLMNHPRIKSIL